jgi:hypothetical protein
MHRIMATLSLTVLLSLAVAAPAFAGMIACPPSPPPGSTLECGVSNSEPEETLTWEASFADGTEESGELTTDEEGSGGLAVAIPDDPELAGTQFTITLETGATYAGMVGAPDEEDGAGAAAAADDADAEVEAQGAEADEEAAEDDADEQVSERPAEDSEVALGAGGTAGTPGLALLVAALGAVLILGGGGVLVRAAARR